MKKEENRGGVTNFFHFSFYLCLLFFLGDAVLFPA